MSMDPDKDMLALPAEAKLEGQKYRPRRPATPTWDGCNGPTTRLIRFSSCGCSVRRRKAQAPSQNAFSEAAERNLTFRHCASRRAQHEATNGCRFPRHQGGSSNPLENCYGEAYFSYV